jgi:hypothetical protein
MPNWCANSLKLVARTDEQRELLNKIKQGNDTDKEYKLFGQFYPCPQELLDTKKSFPVDPNVTSNLKKYGYETWYEFNLDNYGCKWDASDVQLIADTDDYIILNFDTPWSPPQELYRKLTADGWYVEGAWCEQGADFIGAYIDGKEYSDNFNDGSIDWEISDTAWEDESLRISNYFANLSIDHEPAHSGG